LTLSPLKGEIDPAASTYTVSKVKVEVRLQKKAEGRWGKLVKTSDNDRESAHDCQTQWGPVPKFWILFFSEPGPPTDARPADEPLFESRKQRKNWDKVTTEILDKDKDKTTNEDPNAGGDAALNGFFQQLYSGADEDSKRAMMKSFVESGGTTLSTNWDEVKKSEVEVKPPEGYVCLLLSICHTASGLLTIPVFFFRRNSSGKRIASLFYVLLTHLV